MRELDLARRLVYFACTRQVLPKHVEPDLVMLRDPRLRRHGADTLAELAARLTDTRTVVVPCRPSCCAGSIAALVVRRANALATDGPAITSLLLGQRKRQAGGRSA